MSVISARIASTQCAGVDSQIDLNKIDLNKFDFNCIDCKKSEKGKANINEFVKITPKRENKTIDLQKRKRICINWLFIRYWLLYPPLIYEVKL